MAARERERETDICVLVCADVVIRRRLLTRTSTLGKTGLKKCAESLLALLDSFADEGVDADVWCVH